jgi:PHD/YefM family antitoxin component YafN of YafNO toxin-antitoxin module
MTGCRPRAMLPTMPKLDPATDEPVSDLATDTATLLARLRETGRPLVIAERGHHSAVLMDAEVYRALLDELATLRDIRQGLQDIASGRLTPHDEAKVRLLARY